MPASATARARAHQKLTDHLARHGLKQTHQREAILNAFISADGHLTSEEIHERVRGGNPEIGAATVYRTLKLFCEAGIANAHHFRDGVTLYEHTSSHHDHLICTDCGAIIEFEAKAIEKEQDRIARGHGFRLLRHRHILYGACIKEDCPRRGK
jgi:Fur family ferric uptake transcriptional regulator